MRLVPLLLGAAAGALLGCATIPQAPPDQACLAVLRSRGVAFSEGPDLKGVRTPVTLDGSRFSPRLTPRGGRAPEMDCQLAVALANASRVFSSLGIDELEYSGAYDYRNRRRSNRLSAHAAGLAIDVHVFRGPARGYVVAGTFERRPARWRSLAPGPGALRTCVGNTRTPSGRLLRRIACGLRLHEGFRYVITPDDDLDHRDHFHIEADPEAATHLFLASNPQS
jgi:hypothetical protein